MLARCVSEACTHPLALGFACHYGLGLFNEARKGHRADADVRRFFADAGQQQKALFLSVVTIGELRRGIELIRHRGDALQARRLERWLTAILTDFSDNVLDIDPDVAQIWGHLCAPRAENALDKMIAATALIHGLTIVTHNHKHFRATGAPLLDPFFQLTATWFDPVCGLNQSLVAGIKSAIIMAHVANRRRHPTPHTP